MVGDFTVTHNLALVFGGIIINRILPFDNISAMRGSKRLFKIVKEITHLLSFFNIKAGNMENSSAHRTIVFIFITLNNWIRRKLRKLMTSFATTV